MLIISIIITVTCYFELYLFVVVVFFSFDVFISTFSFNRHI